MTNTPATETPVADTGSKPAEGYELPVDPQSNPQYAEPTPAPAQQVEAKPAVTEPTPTPAVTHPNHLIQAAKRIGMDESEYRNMNSAELRDSINLLIQTRNEERRLRGNAQSVQQFRNPQTGQFVSPQAAVQPEAAPAPKEFSLEDAGIDIKALETVEERSELFKTVVKPLFEQLQEVKRQLAEIGTREKRREVETTMEKVDRIFSENPALYGKGSGRELDRQSPEFRRRMSVIREMEAIHNANPNIPVTDALNQAMTMFNGIMPAAPAPAPVNSDPRGFAQGTLGVPQNRDAAPAPKGHNAAVSAVQAKLAELSTVAEPDEWSELPG